MSQGLFLLIFFTCFSNAAENDLESGDELTDALRANFVVTAGALTVKGTQRVDALLAGLAVVFLSLTLVDICVCVCGWGRAETDVKTFLLWANTREGSYVETTWGHGRAVSPRLHPAAEGIALSHACCLMQVM